MRIDSYQVSTNSSYYNLKLAQTHGFVSSDIKDMSKGETDKLSEIELDVNTIKTNELELSKDLSKAILTNLNSERTRIVAQKVELSQIHVESQALSFQTKAFIKAEDKEIEISLDVSLSQSFVEKTDISFESLDKLRDPLVLSLNSSMPSLSSKTFAFDIDSDGKSDQISMLNKHNAFLALDKNNNHHIDDGSELFGTKSGDGFSDLREFDDDKNGWIDENDAIFDKLRVWKKSENNDELIGLGEVGIGAIFLGDTKTPFNIKDLDNETLGNIRSSSMFLYENGTAGFISHIDFAIDKQTKNSIEKLNNINENFRNLILDNPYKTKETESAELSNLDEELEKLQKEYAKLEKKLIDAKPSEVDAIKIKMASINSKMISLMEKTLKD